MSEGASMDKNDSMDFLAPSPILGRFAEV